MVNPAVPANNVQELIALAKSQPGKINFGSAGTGSTPHLSGELFKSLAKIEITHVPYRGAGPAMNDLIGGHVQMFFDLLPASLQQIESGKVRAVSPTAARRAPECADGPAGSLLMKSSVPGSGCTVSRQRRLSRRPRGRIRQWHRPC